MNTSNFRRMIIEALSDIAPELNEAELDADADLREACDIDSMDFLNLLTSIKNTSGTSIPDSDYSKLQTLNQFVSYLEERERG